MKVKEFVEKYNSFSNDTLKDKFIKESINKDYVPYIEKMSICQRIVNATTKKTISIGKNEKEIFYMDSANRYLIFQIQLIQAYTDIVFSDGEEGIKEFELIDQYGINDIIINSIPEREYINFKAILDMKVDDSTFNENNFIQYIDTKIDALRLVIDTMGDSLLDLMKNPEVIEAIQSLENNVKGKEDNIDSVSNKD